MSEFEYCEWVSLSTVSVCVILESANAILQKQNLLSVCIIINVDPVVLVFPYNLVIGNGVGKYDI